jgi:hypothetical protein
MKSGTWLKDIGYCDSEYFGFKHKSKRDYSASQAKNVVGYIKHDIGQFVTKSGKETVYWCTIYTEKDND